MSQASLASQTNQLDLISQTNQTVPAYQTSRPFYVIWRNPAKRRTENNLIWQQIQDHSRFIENKKNY